MMAKGIDTMAITIDVKPDLSRFKQEDPVELAKFLMYATGGFRAGVESTWSPDLVAQQLLEKYVILPR